jgi:hypothetical protein
MRQQRRATTMIAIALMALAAGPVVSPSVAAAEEPAWTDRPGPTVPAPSSLTHCPKDNAIH